MERLPMFLKSKHAGYRLRLACAGILLLIVATLGFYIGSGPRTWGSQQAGAVAGMRDAAAQVGNGQTSSFQGGLEAAPPGKVLPNGIIEGYSSKNDVSPPLSSIKPSSGPPPSAQGEEERENPSPYSIQRPQPFIDDPVLQRTFGSLLPSMPGPSNNFDVIPFTGWYPSDANIDVSYDYVVQTVNTSFQVWNKSGGTLLS